MPEITQTHAPSSHVCFTRAEEGLRIPNGAQLQGSGGERDEGGGRDLAWVSPGESINHGALAAVKGLGATALAPDSPS